jgi:cytochrome c oxidase assembly protein subunit 11
LISGNDHTSSKKKQLAIGADTGLNRAGVFLGSGGQNSSIHSGITMNLGLQTDNLRMLRKLAVVAVLMFGFGYALVPIYKAICELTGINILALGEKELPGSGNARLTNPANTQVDTSRTITVEFDANARGPWQFKPMQNSVEVHPGELATVMYEFQNVQDRTMSAQAIPSYAPREAAAYFNKVECFCFNQYTLVPGEKKQWPVAFVVDPKLAKSVNTITLSYTFFEVGSKTPAAPSGTVSSVKLKEDGV